MSRVSVKRLTLPAILVLILLAAAVSGCVAIPESQPSEVESAGPEPVTVVYWGHNFTPRVELDEKYIAEFMEMYPHITVEYEAMSNTSGVMA